jgi:hypothetical protein
MAYLLRVLRLKLYPSVVVWVMTEALFQCSVRYSVWLVVPYFIDVWGIIGTWLIICAMYDWSSSLLLCEVCGVVLYYCLRYDWRLILMLCGMSGALLYYCFYDWSPTLLLCEVLLFLCEMWLEFNFIINRGMTGAYSIVGLYDRCPALLLCCMTDALLYYCRCDRSPTLLLCQ